MLEHGASILTFAVISFAVQGLSHFVINKAHFDNVAFTRPNPVIAMGVAVMILQGLVLSVALAVWKGGAATIADGLTVSGAFGLFLVSYIAVVEPSKYDVPSIRAWIRVEGLAGLVQFAAFGVALGAIHQAL